MKLAVLCSLILSILHSILFYGKRWGISIFLFTIVGLFFFIRILEKNEKIKNKKALLISIPIIILSTTYFLFNNAFFNIFNIVVILLLFLIMIILAVLGEIKINKLIENFFVLFFGPIEEMGESSREISKCFAKKQTEKAKDKNLLLKQIGKGILYSAPLIIIVTILLITADEMFASIFNNMFSAIFTNINLKTIYSMVFRILIVIALTIYFIGMIIKIKKDELDNEGGLPNKIKIEGITLSTLLTLLNIIYLIFSFTQGVQLIRNINASEIDNYAQYARTGFFQLMAVSLINFVVILISKNNKKEVDCKVQRYIKTMNVLLAIFTIIILISSVLRMNLYEQEYGYTFLRLMVYFIQITELILIVPTIIYIVKEKFDILKYYIIITISMYIVVNFANLDYIIAKGNIDRYFEMKDDKKAKIDFSYLEDKTSTDALPEIIRLLKTDDKFLKARVNNYLLEEYEDLKEEERSLVEFNLSKQSAQEKLEKLNLEYISVSDYYETTYNYKY